MHAARKEKEKDLHSPDRVPAILLIRPIALVMLVYFTNKLVDFRDRELLRLHNLEDSEGRWWRRTDCYKRLALQRL